MAPAKTCSNIRALRSSLTKSGKIDQGVHDDSCNSCRGKGTDLVCCEVCPAVFHPECVPRGDDASCETYICRECIENAGVARYSEGDPIEFNYAQKGKWYPGTVMGAQLGNLGWCFSCTGMEAGGTTWVVLDIEGDDLRRPGEGEGYCALSKRKAQRATAIEGSHGGRGSGGGGSGRAHSCPPTTKANRQERSDILVAAGWTVRVLSSATYQYTSFDGKFKYRSCDKAWNHHMEASEARGKGPGNASGRGSGSSAGAARGGRGSS